MKAFISHPSKLRWIVTNPNTTFLFLCYQLSDEKEVWVTG